jgi:cbb3-type cytochrome oxidase maturation protein
MRPAATLGGRDRNAGQLITGDSQCAEGFAEAEYIMQILFVLIPLGLALLGIAVWAFFWAVKNDQFEDMQTPAWRILMDKDGPDE